MGQIKGLLGDVAGIVVVAAETKGEPVSRLVILLDKGLEYLGVLIPHRFKSIKRGIWE
jgi:hypothetical protein